MKRMVLVAAACVAMVVFVLWHKYAGALIVGIVAGTPLYLFAVAKGGGVAQMRITQDPGVPRKPGDPNVSIGMGLAAAGIGAAAMGYADYSHYPPAFRVFYTVCFVVGMLIALVFSGKNMRTAASSNAAKPNVSSSSDETDSTL